MMLWLIFGEVNSQLTKDVQKAKIDIAFLSGIHEKCECHCMNAIIKISCGFRIGVFVSQ